MIDNEIHSCTAIIGFEYYLNMNPKLESKEVDLNVYKVKIFNKLLIDEVTGYTIIGLKQKEVLLKHAKGIFFKDISDVKVAVSVVLEEQIKHLKYSKQTELFKDGKDT